jgi:hypothetical protein
LNLRLLAKKFQNEYIAVQGGEENLGAKQKA